MGARVIAVGRDEQKLSELKNQIMTASPNAEMETVTVTGDEAKDEAALKAFGPVDAVLGFTPHTASASTYTRGAIKALRRGGKVSLMGHPGNFSTPEVTNNDLELKGKIMCERDDILQFVKMIERGLFPRGRLYVDTRAYPLEDWKEGLDAAAEHSEPGKPVVFTPYMTR